MNLSHGKISKEFQKQFRNIHKPATLYFLGNNTDGFLIITLSTETVVKFLSYAKPAFILFYFVLFTQYLFIYFLPSNLGALLHGRASNFRTQTQRYASQLTKIYLITSLSPYLEILAILPSAVAKIQDCPIFILFY